VLNSSGFNPYQGAFQTPRSPGIGAQAEGISKQAYYQRILNDTKQLITELDQNHDGVITLGETPNQVMFVTHDLDGSGSIDLSEMTAGAIWCHDTAVAMGPLFSDPLGNIMHGYVKNPATRNVAISHYRQQFGMAQQDLLNTLGPEAFAQDSGQMTMRPGIAAELAGIPKEIAYSRLLQGNLNNEIRTND
jgi:hypothetical protein